MTFLGKVAVSESWMAFGFDRRFHVHFLQAATLDNGLMQTHVDGRVEL